MPNCAAMTTTLYRVAAKGAPGGKVEVCGIDSFWHGEWDFASLAGRLASR